MNPIALSFVGLTGLALLALPRRWAALPLLAAACYITLGQGVSVGPFTFTVIRMLVAVGVVRVVLRREQLPGGLNVLDWSIAAWALWACASVAFRDGSDGGLVFRLGLVYNALGIYGLLRIFCTSLDDAARLCRMTIWLLVPVASEMLYEHITLHNAFSIFGGVPEVPQLREGRIRAFGPFTHPILAGTVGAVTLPLAAGISRQHRKTAALGIAVCLTIVLCSASSGPIMSAVLGIGGLAMWRSRERMRQVRWACVGAYLLLEVAMKAPAYYLIARIDVAGGSTGWHRARLIESAVAHLEEWWLTGTAYTRHWMPTGVSWNPNHTDITNHYLYMGVLGGLPLLLLFASGIAVAFCFVGRAVRAESVHPGPRAFMAWSLGAGLFAHAATCISVSYFDQSFLFLYLNLAAASSACAVACSTTQAPVRITPSMRAPGTSRVTGLSVAHSAPALDHPIGGWLSAGPRVAGQRWRRHD